MPIYICQDCEKNFDHKSKYERHINRKNKCTEMTQYKKRKFKKLSEEILMELKIEEKVEERLKEILSK